jgi:hypothetical protein
MTARGQQNTITEARSAPLSMPTDLPMGECLTAKPGQTTLKNKLEIRTNNIELLL